MNVERKERERETVGFWHCNYKSTNHHHLKRSNRNINDDDDDGEAILFFTLNNFFVKRLTRNCQEETKKLMS